MLRLTEAVETTMVRIDDLDDGQLAATAYVWRRRAQAGEKNAHQTWDRMEQELRRRLGPTPSDYAPLMVKLPERRPWWRPW